MKVVYRADNDGNLWGHSEKPVIIQATEMEWDLIVRFTGQSQNGIGTEVTEVDIKKFNRSLLKLKESKHQLSVAISEIDKIEE